MKIVTFIFSVFFALPVLSNSTSVKSSLKTVSSENNNSEEFGIKTDDRNFKEIFESNLKQSQIDIYSKRKKYDMEFSYSNSRPVNSKFANDYYEIPYSENVSSLSTFGFYAGYELFQNDKYLINPLVGFSYTFEESIIEAKNKSGGTYKDVIKFQSIPIFLGTKLGYKIPQWLNSTIYTRIGFTHEWVSIAGSLDGINQSHWNSGYSASFGLTLLQPVSTDLNTWFGGISISAGLLRPFQDNMQGSKSNFFEVGMNFYL